MKSNGMIPTEQLEAPFPAELIKSRPGAFGGSLSYLEGHTVIARLNEAFQGGWSFDIVSHEVMEEEVLIVGRFRAQAAGIVKMAFGSSRITRDKRTGNPTALGDDLKAAATDALKKSATLLGVGLYLYGNDGNGAAQPDDRPFDEDLRTRPVRPANGQSGNVNPQGGNGTNGNGRVTNKQISAIFAIARERGMSNADVRAMCQDRYQRTVDYLSRINASHMIEHLLGQ